MKKILIALLIITMALPMVMADAQPAIEYKGTTDFAFHPASSRISGMGGSGIAAPGRIDSFYQNPAALGLKRFGMSLPSLTFTTYNMAKLLSSEAAVNHIVNMMNGTEAFKDGIIPVATEMIGNLGSGTNEFFTTDVGVAFGLGNFGLSANIQEKVHSIVPKGSANIGSVRMVPEINVSATGGLGIRVMESEGLNVDVGASVHFVYKMFSQQISGSDVIGWISSSDGMDKKLMWNTPVAAGWALPIDLGVTLGFLNDTLKVSAVANDINSVYSMKSYSSAGDMIKDLFKKDVNGKPDGHVTKDSTEYKINTPWSLTFGLAWMPKVAILNPVITADLVDMVNLVSGKEKFEWKNLLLHLNAGAEFNVISRVSLRAGVNRGYLSVGTAVDLWAVKVEAAYAWQEFGKEIGDKPVDTFSVRINLGVDTPVK